MVPALARLIGSFSLFVQMAGVALVLGVWTAVRQSARRPRFDAWWIGMLFLVLGLFALILGLVVAAIDTSIPATVGETRPAIPFVYAWVVCHDLSAWYFYLGSKRLLRESASPRARYYLLGALAVMIVVVPLAPQVFIFAMHSSILAPAYGYVAWQLARKIGAFRGTGIRIVCAAFVGLTIVFALHIPLVLLPPTILGAPAPMGGTYVAVNAYATLLIEVVLGVGMLVAEVDAVNDALATANARLITTQGRLRELVDTDALTGLRNRGALDRAREQTQFTSGHIVCLDLDGLKQINDRHGHLFGDRAIRTFAEALAACAEQPERVYRIGGDEFLLVFVAESEREIVLRLEAMQRGLRVAHDDGTDMPMRASFGIAHFDDAATFAHAVALADARMYAHKARAR